jgi:single-strand DNA-binding protein
MSASPATFTGNITQDPEIRFMESGTAKLSFSIACNHYWTDQSGEKQEKTSFFNCVAWRNLAEDAANVLEKGMRVVVTGRLEQRSYEDKEGNNRSIIELVADEVALSTRGLEAVTRKQRSGNGGQQQQQSRRVPTKSAPRQQRIVEDQEPF